MQSIPARFSDTPLKHDDSSDGELIERARSGDELAFRRIVQRYEPSVAATIVAMLGRTDEARDVGQQVFIRFFRAIDDFRGDSSLRTYLTRIAINLSLNEQKRQQRYRKRFVDLEDVGEASTSGESTIESMETRRLVQTAIGQLSEPFRLVVQLRMIEGFTVKETSDILNVPTGTVLSRLARAQSKLASKLLPHVKPGDKQ